MVEHKRVPKAGTWEDRLSAQVGRNIAAARARLGLSAQALSDELRDLGAPLGRPAISQAETGHRRISLAEVIAIAAVLEVSPAELVFDPLAETVEALPGHGHVTGANAYQWLSGDLASLNRPGETVEYWSAYESPHRVAQPRDRYTEIHYRLEVATAERLLMAAYWRAADLDRAMRYDNRDRLGWWMQPGLNGTSPFPNADALMRELVDILGHRARQLEGLLLCVRAFGYDDGTWLWPDTRKLLERFRLMYQPDGLAIFGYRLAVSHIDRQTALHRDIQALEVRLNDIRTTIAEMESEDSPEAGPPTFREIVAVGELAVTRLPQVAPKKAGLDA